MDKQIKQILKYPVKLLPRVYCPYLRVKVKDTLYQKYSFYHLYIQ